MNRRDRKHREQPSLFESSTFAEAVRVIDDDGSVTRIARRNDPDTSQDGAEHIEPTLNVLQGRMLQAFASPRTAREAAEWCVRNFPGESTEKESYRKRKDELRKLGLIEFYAKRPCEISGKSAEVFVATKQD